MNLCEVINHWCGFLFFRGYGDPGDSNGGNIPITDTYTCLFSTGSKPALVLLENTGAATIEIQANDQKNGKTMAAGDVLALDHFKGSLYCRTMAAGVVSLVNWCVFVVNK